MTTHKQPRRGPFEIHEETWSNAQSLIEKACQELGFSIEGEISLIQVRQTSFRIEAEVLAADGTWDHTNVYERRFTYPPNPPTRTNR